MKIALIAPTYLPARRANTIQVMKMAQAFTRLDHVVLVSIPGLPEQPVSWQDLANQYGLQQQFGVEWLPVNPRLRNFDFGWRAVRQARRQGVDLVYTRHPQAAALAAQLGMPTILEVHDLPGGRVGPRLLRLFLRGSGAKRLVVITHHLLHALEEQLGGAYKVQTRTPFCVVLPDGVDLERYQDLPPPLVARQFLAQSGALPGLDVERFTAGYTGHLYSGRGLNLILEMARRLPLDNFLLVGGEPASVEETRQAAHSAGLENVWVAGFVPNANLPRYQAACDVLLMPYQRQVAASSGGDIGRFLSPMKLFEYLACRRPILTSDLVVLREILDEQSAVLLPPDDPEAWTQAIEALQKDPVRQGSLAQAAGTLAGKYTWDARARRLLED
jgi:glycosyltransferase involved in cell wall biosynthesis